MNWFDEWIDGCGATAPGWYVVLSHGTEYTGFWLSVEHLKAGEDSGYIFGHCCVAHKGPFLTSEDAEKWREEHDRY